MISNLKRIKNLLIPIGVIVSVLASILALIILYQLVWALPVLSPPFTTDGGDNALYFATINLFTRYRDLYWLLTLIAIETGLLISLSGRGYMLTFMILMLILTLSALLIRGVYVWIFVMWPGTHRNLLLFAKNVLFYGDEYILALPVFGLVLAIIMFLFQNKNIKTA